MCSHGSVMTEQPVCFVSYSASDFAGSALGIPQCCLFTLEFHAGTIHTGNGHHTSCTQAPYIPEMGTITYRKRAPYDCLPETGTVPYRKRAPYIPEMGTIFPVNLCHCYLKAFGKLLKVVKTLKTTFTCTRLDPVVAFQKSNSGKGKGRVVYL